MADPVYQPVVSYRHEKRSVLIKRFNYRKHNVRLLLYVEKRLTETNFEANREGGGRPRPSPNPSPAVTCPCCRSTKRHIKNEYGQSACAALQRITETKVNQEQGRSEICRWWVVTQCIIMLCDAVDYRWRRSTMHAAGCSVCLHACSGGFKGGRWGRPLPIGSIFFSSKKPSFPA